MRNSSSTTPNSKANPVPGIAFKSKAAPTHPDSRIEDDLPELKNSNFERHLILSNDANKEPNQVLNELNKTAVGHSTKNALQEKIRVQVAGALQERLCCAIDLSLQAKHAHWNTRGPNFVSVHALFDQVASDASEYADWMAERIVQLGGVAGGLIRDVSKGTQLPAVQPGAMESHQFLNSISTAIANFCESGREITEKAAALGDFVTADLMTEILRKLDKTLWMVEASTPRQ